MKRDPGLKKISSLYIHIPFCVRKCIYCDFFSVHYDETSATEYVDALCRELVSKKELASTLKTIYIGGGTPSLLPEALLIKLFHCLRHNFSLSPEAEITVEANPGTLDDAKIKCLLSMGVNRLSVGVQSFNDNELRILGRIHDALDTFTSIDLIRRSGMTNYSVDLMYGIPGQTMESWRYSILKALEFLPAHISTYELTPEKGTPLHKAIETGSVRLPDEESILEMYGYALGSLSSRGYEHYEISNFALPGRRCVHNVNYWKRGQYIGAGPGSHSFLNDTRSRNTKDIDEYIESVNRGRTPEAESAGLTSEDILRELIFLGLRKREGIRISGTVSVSRKLPNGRADLRTALMGASEELIEEGLMEVGGDRLRLTRRGIVLSNAVIVRLFEKLGL